MQIALYLLPYILTFVLKEGSDTAVDEVLVLSKAFKNAKTLPCMYNKLNCTSASFNALSLVALASLIKFDR